MAPKSNVALLTEGADYIRRAKKARQDQVEEVKWDDESRRDYLTGFSKRKKQRIEERRARAKARDHQAHLEERRKARQELRERAKQNVRDVRMALGLSVDDDEEVGSGEEEEEAAPIETNFSDDEQLATVTITEDFDFSKASGERAYVDSDDEDATDGAPKKKPVVPLLPASSKRAEQKAKREKEKKAEAKERAKNEAKKAEKKSTSMETPAERRRAKELEARKRQKKFEKEKKQAEKYGISLVKGKSGGGAKGGKGKGGKSGKGGKPAGKKGGRR